MVIAALSTAVCLAGACLIAAGTEESRRQKAQQILIQNATTETVEIAPLQAEVLTLGATPAPEQKLIVMPEDAVEIICQERHIAVLPSRDEAETMLTEYLYACTLDQETERTVSACFDVPVYIVDAIGDIPMTDAETVIEQLLAQPNLIPVRMERERREMEMEMEPAPQFEEDDSLAKGTRVVTQLGSACRLVTTTDLTYVAGEIVTGSDPITRVLEEARTPIIRIGTYKAAKPNGEPGAEEGAVGRENKELRLAEPILQPKTQISSNFGTRYAPAGTKLGAPGEGLVVWLGERGAYGYVVDIDHGDGFVSRLTHCDGVRLELNQRIFKGDQVGTLAANADGSTPVLHYELLIDGVPHNPVPFLGNS